MFCLKKLIFECETLVAAVAMILWLSQMQHRLYFCFVENEGAKLAIIRGCCDYPTVDAIIGVFCEKEAVVQTFNWISRVACFSNIADAPSRGECQYCISLTTFFAMTLVWLLLFWLLAE